MILMIAIVIFGFYSLFTTGVSNYFLAGLIMFIGLALSKQIENLRNERGIKK